MKSIAYWFVLVVSIALLLSSCSETDNSITTTTTFSSGDSKDIFNTANIFGYLSIILAAVNIFGGFLVTQRMLAMYKKKKKDK